MAQLYRIAAQLMFCRSLIGSFQEDFSKGGGGTGGRQGQFITPATVGVSCTVEPYYTVHEYKVFWHVPGSAPGCRSGNGEKLSSTQAESGQAIKSAVA